MSNAEVANRHISKHPFVEHNDFRQGGQYMMRSNSVMSYQRGSQTFGDSVYVPSSTTSYSSPQPSHVMIDDWDRPYIHRGENEIGMWRSYVSQAGCWG